MISKVVTGRQLFSHAALAKSAECWQVPAWRTTHPPRSRSRTSRSSQPRRSCGRGRSVTLHAAPQYNPQNVPNPQVMPQKEFSPEEAVATQMDALLHNDEPWPNHGIQTMYEFGWDIGGMERSRYFGYSKDLYHFDHFLGQFRNAFGELVDADSYKIGESRTGADDGVVEVDVTVKSSTTQQNVGLCFRMQKKDIGMREGCWMTKTISNQN